MKIKLILCVLAACVTLYADEIILSSGKTITGSIKSFNNYSGLNVETEFGEITIKPGNIVSFVVNDDVDYREDVTLLENSRLYQKGILIDTSKLSEYTYFFDKKNEDAGSTLSFYGTHKVYGVTVMMVTEELDVSLDDYLQLSLQMMQQQSQYVKKGTLKSEKINGIDMKVIDFEAKINGNEIQYIMGFFKKGESLFKITSLGLSLLVKNRRDVLKEFFHTISFMKTQN